MLMGNHKPGGRVTLFPPGRQSVTVSNYCLYSDRGPLTGVNSLPIVIKESRTCWSRVWHAPTYDFRLISTVV